MNLKQRKRNKEIAAEQARQLFENPLLKQALDELREEAELLLDKAPVFGLDVFKRQHQLIMFRQVTNRFEKKLRKHIEDAAFAQRNSAQAE